jgi:hypothetical protein
MNPTDADMVEVSESADSPEFSDRGYSVVPVPVDTPPLPPDEPKPTRRVHRGKGPANSVDAISDEELMTEAGVDPIFSTTEAAEFFDRSNQWLYWGLREGVFTDDDGVPLDPSRLGSPHRGRRRFTLPIIRNIMRSSYRRGNIHPDHLKVILRRIKYAERGIEWREQEGWRHVHLGKSRYKWVRPEDAEWDTKAKEWRETPEAKQRRESKKRADD